MPKEHFTPPERQMRRSFVAFVAAVERWFPAQQRAGVEVRSAVCPLGFPQDAWPRRSGHPRKRGPIEDLDPTGNDPPALFDALPAVLAGEVHIVPAQRPAVLAGHLHHHDRLAGALRPNLGNLDRGGP